MATIADIFPIMNWGYAVRNIQLPVMPLTDCESGRRKLIKRYSPEIEEQKHIQ